MPVENMTADLLDWVSDPLRAIVAHLAKNDMTDAAGQLDLSNLVECDFAGYAPQPITNIRMDAESTDEVAHAIADAVEFVAGPGVIAQRPTIVYFTEVYDGGTPGLLKWVPLDNVATINRPGQKITSIMEVWATDLS